MKKLLFTALMTSAAYAATPVTITQSTTPGDGSTCQILRQAQASIVVMKETPTLTNGVWTTTGTEVGRATTAIPVIGAQMSGCQIDSVRIDNVPLNGSTESVNVNAYMRVLNHTNGAAYKAFSTSYWVSSDGGRSGWGSSDVDDVTQQTLQLNMNLESTAPTTTTRPEYVYVSVKFTDNAQ